MLNRKCKVCGELKPKDELSQLWGGNPVCKPCVRARNAAYQRRRRMDNPDLVRASNLWHHHRITVEEYEAMRAAQDRRCAICRRHEDDLDPEKVGGRPRSDGREMTTRSLLVIDHCHTEDAIRGLLCHPCNAALGQLEDDPARFRAAARYLETAARQPIDRNRVNPRRIPQEEALF